MDIRITAGPDIAPAVIVGNHQQNVGSIQWSFAQNGDMVTPLCGHGKNVDEGGRDFRWERCFLGVHGTPFAPQGAT